MVKVFIDLGSFHGAIIRKFMASSLYSPDFVIHAFEPNPAIDDSIFESYPRGVVVHKEVAWIGEGEVDFFISKVKPYRVQGSSVYKEKVTGNLDTDHPIKIRCFDFSKWLRDNFTEDDFVIVKANIEGAEYPIFSKIVDDGNIGIIKQLYLRRHWNKIGMSEQDDSRFMVKLASAGNLKIFNAYNF